MEVIGQFNNSFILCQLNRELYILDQHACDEKSNYEELMKDVVIHSQRLIQWERRRRIRIRPLSLELSPDQEFVVIHEMEVFAKNGFDVLIDETKMLGSRVCLRGLPSSKQYTFTVEGRCERILIIGRLFGVVERGYEFWRNGEENTKISEIDCHACLP